MLLLYEGVCISSKHISEHVSSKWSILCCAWKETSIIQRPSNTQRGKQRLMDRLIASLKAETQRPRAQKKHVGQQTVGQLESFFFKSKTWVRERSAGHPISPPKKKQHQRWTLYTTCTCWFWGSNWDFPFFHFLATLLAGTKMSRFGSIPWVPWRPWRLHG